MWKDWVAELVDGASNTARTARLAELPSAQDYAHTKHWGRTPSEYAFSTGEVDRWGHRTPGRYLDDRRDLKGTRLKLLCRTGALPVMRRLGREQRPPWPLERSRCYACHTGAVESVSHFLGECRTFAGHSTPCGARSTAASAPYGGMISYVWATRGNAGSC